MEVKDWYSGAEEALGRTVERETKVQEFGLRSVVKEAKCLAETVFVNGAFNA